MKSKAILLLLSMLLTGCIAAVVAGAAGMVVYDRRSVVMIESDARIFYVVNTAIASDPRFRGSHIVVSSFNQTVLLAGQTPTASLRVVAKRLHKARLMLIVFIMKLRFSSLLPSPNEARIVG